MAKYRSRAMKVPGQGISFSLEGDFTEKLRKLDNDLRTKVLRSGAYAAARVIYDEMHQQVPVGKTGKLYASIYHWHDDKRSTSGKQIYAIGPNKQGAIGATKGADGQAKEPGFAPHWHLIEYGHWRYNRSINGRWQRSKSVKSKRGPDAHDLPGALAVPVWVPAIPFVRRTWDNKIQAALDAGLKRIGVRFTELVKGKA